ncbi:UNKNOWN [Stylonychia lemnae]|uniref:Uncharacterized protein n=1 Tax=Stylonychia lemnae TaxID=5949 RepID=A0A078ARU5_STYLE|nr:UNKNOWN [Stylonychia lemnae]|eukprot:CDW83912.1 UNKNOWN [Stylonychia lemnae]
MQSVSEVGRGTLNFLSQFRPRALEHQSAKNLLMTDQNYGTPQDSYFAYINKRKKEAAIDTNREEYVLSNLGLEKLLPLEINENTNKLEIKSLSDDLIREIQEINPDLKIEDTELLKITQMREQAIERYVQKTIEEDGAQKFTKKDYQVLNSLKFTKIMEKVEDDKIEKQFSDDEFSSQAQQMLKIQKKKDAVKNKREQRLMDKEIQRLLQNPQKVDVDKALELYDNQPIEAKQVTNKDLRKLRRLKRKAEKVDAALQKPQIAQSAAEQQQSIDNQSQEAVQQQEQEIKTAIKFAEELGGANINSEIVDVDDLIK